MRAGMAEAWASALRQAWRGTRVDGVGMALLLALWLWGLGAAPLFDVDEGAFAEASREMLASGDWGHTTLNGADRFDKPILVYWLQAAAVALLGPSEAAVRLPSALCAWAWCLVVAGFAAQRWGARAGRVAALVLATSVGPLLIGRAATADALLNLLLALTLLDLWRAIEEPSGPDLDAGTSRRAAGRRAFAWAGLGLLAKGPVAVVLPAGALLLWVLFAGRAWREPLARLRVLASDGAAWAWLLGLALPWYAYALQRHGWAFVDGFLLHHNLDRMAQPLEGHRGPWAYHLLVMPLLLLPWTPLLAALWRARRLVWAEPLGRYLLAAVAVVLGLFTLAATKLPHYALYGFTPLVLLLVAAGAAQSPGRGLLAAVTGLSALLVLAGAASVPLAHALIDAPGLDAHWRERLTAMLDAHGPASGGAMGWLAAIALAVAWAWPVPHRRMTAMAAAAVMATLWWTATVLPWWAQGLQGPIRELALQARAEARPLVQWGLHQPSAGWYRGAPVPRRAPQPGELALVRSDRVEPLAAAAGLRWHEVARAPGYLLVRVEPLR